MFATLNFLEKLKNKENWGPWLTTWNKWDRYWLLIQLFTQRPRGILLASRSEESFDSGAAAPRCTQRCVSTRATSLPWRVSLNTLFPQTATPLAGCTSCTLPLMRGSRGFNPSLANACKNRIDPPNTTLPISSNTSNPTNYALDEDRKCQSSCPSPPQGRLDCLARRGLLTPSSPVSQVRSGAWQVQPVCVAETLSAHKRYWNSLCRALPQCNGIYNLRGTYGHKELPNKMLFFYFLFCCDYWGGHQQTRAMEWNIPLKPAANFCNLSLSLWK